MSTHKHSSDPNRPYSVPSVSALRLGSVIPSEITPSVSSRLPSPYANLS
jgi:hypothetical protein